jgi:hypothetical protein
MTANKLQTLTKFGVFTVRYTVAQKKSRIGCWVYPKNGLDDIEKLKFLILSGHELRHLSHPARNQSY